MKKGYKQLIEELEDSLQAYTNYRTRAEEKIKDLQSLLEDSATKNAVRFDNSVELYAFRNNITPVDVFERISKGDNELKTIIEDIANGAK